MTMYLSRKCVELQKKLILKDSGFLYAIKQPQHTDIYKVGRTQNMEQRLRGYPHGTVLLYRRFVTNVVKRERLLLQELKDRTMWRRDYGYEYFGTDDVRIIFSAIDKVSRHRL
jgi:hypothetical protein